MNIGNKIKALRLKASATQEMLAEALGVSSQSVSKWENNVCAPDISLFPAISEFFGVTIDELFDLTTDQKLHRIENMLDYETELTDEQFRSTEAFLLEIKDSYNENDPEKVKGRIESFLAHLYHHRMVSDARYVSLYARKAMNLHPNLKEDQWLLSKREGAYVWDWNARQHNKTIEFYKELVELNPEIGRNYLFLMDNLIADHRTNEAADFLNKYKELVDHKEVLVPVYEEALKRYKKAEELGKADKEHVFMDHLQAQALIYEILGRYTEAYDYVQRQIDFLKDEWNITEGADVDELEEEKNRLLNRLL